MVKEFFTLNASQILNHRMWQCLKLFREWGAWLVTLTHHRAEEGSRQQKGEGEGSYPVEEIAKLMRMMGEIRMKQ